MNLRLGVRAIVILISITLSSICFLNNKPIIITENHTRESTSGIHFLLLLFLKFHPFSVAEANKAGYRNSTLILAIWLGGRTGNILFEIASGLAIAARYNLDVCAESGHYHILQQLTQLLNIGLRTCSSNILRRIKEGDMISAYNHAYVFEDFYVNRDHGGSYSQGNGTRMSLDELFGSQREKLGDLIYLSGYRSSWKYLKLGSYNEAEMALTKEVFWSARAILEKMFPNVKRVAVHLRVGDASNPSHLYNFPGPEYIREAKQHFRRKWGGRVKFLVFADNPGWCKNQSLLATEDTHIVDGSQERFQLPPLDKVRSRHLALTFRDLALMSACNGVVTSLGSYGWWAGRFSFQNGGEVVYFKNTFNVSQVRELGEVAKVEDYFPPEWLGIDAPALDRQGRMVQYLKGDVLSPKK